MNKLIIDIPQANASWVVGVNDLLEKPNKMSEFEREELGKLVKAMSDEEMVLTAKVLPDDVLISEILRRYYMMRSKLHDMRCVFGTEK